LTTKFDRESQREQEKACAQTFLHWLGLQHGASYELQRAEECPELKGRWDFIARAEGDTIYDYKGAVFPRIPRGMGWTFA
jgi:hypothetical protein